MSRKLLIALMVAGIGATAAGTAGVLLNADSAAARAVSPGQAQAKPAPLQPDTSSPQWKAISEDLGVWIREDERLGLRGRLYVRMDGLWWPVATDGPADVSRTLPTK